MALQCVSELRDRDGNLVKFALILNSNYLTPGMSGSLTAADYDDNGTSDFFLLGEGNSRQINFKNWYLRVTMVNDRYWTVTTDLGGSDQSTNITFYHSINGPLYLTILIDKDTNQVALRYAGCNHPPAAGYAYNVELMGTFFSWTGEATLKRLLSAVPREDPYLPGGTSGETETVDGNFDDTSDVIDLPSIPGFNLTFSGMVSVFAPTLAQVQSLGAYLWTNFDVFDQTKTLSKVFQNPLESILSLHYLPFTPQKSTDIEVTLAGFATGVNMDPCAEQFHDVDCGSLAIAPYWGNYLDYSFTRILLCLPFVGQVELDPDEVMGKTVSVKYRVDVITGAFVCFVYLSGDKVLGQYSGNCAMQVPVSAADYSRLNAAVLGVAATAASGFAGAAVGGATFGQASGKMLSSMAGNVQNAKVRAQHSGGLTGAPGFMGLQKPYVIIHRPRQSVPANYNQFRGYPSNVTMTLSNCSGFTSVREIVLDGLAYTDEELEELRSILEGGVFL